MVFGSWIVRPPRFRVHDPTNIADFPPGLTNPVAASPTSRRCPAYFSRIIGYDFPRRGHPGCRKRYLNESCCRNCEARRLSVHGFIWIPVSAYPSFTQAPDKPPARGALFPAHPFHPITPRHRGTLTSPSEPPCVPFLRSQVLKIIVSPPFRKGEVSR